MADEGEHHSCCLRATAEEVESDPEAFDCETCPVRLWQARLDDEDRLALQVFRSLTQPGIQELGLVPVVFEAFGLTMTRQDAHGLLQRVSALYAHAASKQAARTALHEED